MFDSAVSLRQKEDNAAQLTISSASNVLDSQRVCQAATQETGSEKSEI